MLVVMLLLPLSLSMYNSGLTMVVVAAVVAARQQRRWWRWKTIISKSGRQRER
jgi:hypothetical protein